MFFVLTKAGTEHSLQTFSLAEDNSLVDIGTIKDLDQKYPTFAQEFISSF